MNAGATLLLLILVANGAPVLARCVLGARLRQPVDGGRRFVDGARLLGGSKTWAGLAAAVGAAAACAPALGLPVGLGVAAGLSAMAGDLLSSFIKRRLGRPPSSRAYGLDQIPEALLPALILADPLQLDAATVTMTVAAFVLLDVVLSRLLYRVGLRKHPY